MKEEGLVLEIKDELAVVQLKRSAACESCRCCRVAEQSDFMTAEALNQAGSKIGDMVIVEIEQKEVLLASVVVYLMPIFLMIIGYLFGSYLGKAVLKAYPQETGIIFGFTFLAFSYLIVMLTGKRVAKTRWLQPVVVEVIRD